MRGYKLENLPVTVLTAPRPTSYLQLEQMTLASKGLALLEFFQYAVLFFQSLINADNFSPPWSGLDFQTFFDFEQRKYLYLI